MFSAAFYVNLSASVGPISVSCLPSGGLLEYCIIISGLNDYDLLAPHKDKASAPGLTMCFLKPEPV